MNKRLCILYLYLFSKKQHNDEMLFLTLVLNRERYTVLYIKQLVMAMPLNIITIFLFVQSKYKTWTSKQYIVAGIINRLNKSNGITICRPHLKRSWLLWRYSNMALPDCMVVKLTYNREIVYLSNSTTFELIC